LTGRVRSAFSICVCFNLMIGREVRPVTDDRMRPVVQGAYWTLTGRWRCRVRSFLLRVRSLFCCALLRLDQCVRSFTGPARPVVRSASGQRVKRVRSVLHDLAVVRPARLVVWTSASGQLDQRVRSAQFQLFKFLTALFEGVRL
jgi:hypothetical protein